MYKEALEAVKMFVEPKPGFVYTPTYIVHLGTFDEHMEYAGCYLGGMLALGANTMQSGLNSSSIENDNQKEGQNRINRHFEYANKITETCQQASEQSLTGLGPNSFYFTFDSQDVVTYAGYGQYDLSPELAESNFILWRLTHNQKYRDNAWKMARAIHLYCRVDGSGYSQIENINQRTTVKTGHQPAIFLSATLKYLYLTFTDDSVLPLDQFVFNSNGHPIRVNS